MLRKLLKKIIKEENQIQGIEFVIKVLGSYALWKWISNLLEHFQPQSWTFFLDFIANFTLRIASGLLHIFQINSKVIGRNIFLPNTEGMYVADHCIGFPAIIVFTFIIILFSGKMIHKLWFIPLGIFLIFSMICIRAAALAYIQAHFSKDFWNLNHSYVYLITTYGFILLLINFWMNHFGETNSKD